MFYKSFLNMQENHTSNLKQKSQLPFTVIAIFVTSFYLIPQEKQK